MTLERLFWKEGEGGNGDDGSFVREAKRPRLLFDAVREVMSVQSVQKHLEPFLRKVVQEEVCNALHRHTRSTPRLPSIQIQASATRQYRLHFQSKLPDTLYTGSKIEAEGKLPVQINIVDTRQNEIIRSGPLSSIRIEILVLDGDFGGDEKEDWTEEEFCESLVREREGKRPLLTGEVVITLSNGVGYLGDAIFTDNSSWIRSRKFRLGARVSQTRCTVGRIQEAISEAFSVKDHRGELYKKHHPPSLHDEVWRLEKIGKDGAFHKRLSENQIDTVRDFLRTCVMDQAKLRSLLGSGMSNKIWETTVEHAKECDIGDKHYSYCSVQGIVLVFDSIFQLVGAIIDQIYLPFDNLTPSQKVIVNKWKQVAYENQGDIVELNEPLIENFPRILPPIDTNPVPGPSLLVSHITDIPARHQDEPVAQVSFHHQQHDACNGSVEDIFRQREMFTLQDCHPSQQIASFRNNGSNVRDLFDTQFTDMQADLCNSGSVRAMIPDEQLMGYNTEVNVLNSSVFPVPWGQASGSETSGGYNLPHNGSKWIKLVAALKWMSISKRLAAKRARIMHPCNPTLEPSMCSDAHLGWW